MPGFFDLFSGNRENDKNQIRFYKDDEFKTYDQIEIIDSQMNQEKSVKDCLKEYNNKQWFVNKQESQNRSSYYVIIVVYIMERKYKGLIVKREIMDHEFPSQALEKISKNIQLKLQIVKKTNNIPYYQDSIARPKYNYSNLNELNRSLDIIRGGKLQKIDEKNKLITFDVFLFSDNLFYKRVKNGQTFEQNIILSSVEVLQIDKKKFQLQECSTMIQSQNKQQFTFQAGSSVDNDAWVRDLKIQIAYAKDQRSIKRMDDQIKNYSRKSYETYNTLVYINMVGPEQLMKFKFNREIFQEWVLQNLINHNYSIDQQQYNKLIKEPNVSQEKIDLSISQNKKSIINLGQNQYNSLFAKIDIEIEQNVFQFYNQILELDLQENQNEELKNNSTSLLNKIKDHLSQMKQQIQDYQIYKQSLMQKMDQQCASQEKELQIQAEDLKNQSINYQISTFGLYLYQTEEIDQFIEQKEQDEISNSTYMHYIQDLIVKYLTAFYYKDYRNVSDRRQFKQFKSNMNQIPKNQYLLNNKYKKILRLQFDEIKQELKKGKRNKNSKPKYTTLINRVNTQMFGQQTLQQSSKLRINSDKVD